MWHSSISICRKEVATNFWKNFALIRDARTFPVVIVTSSDAPQDRKRAAQLGATRYFRKPPELDDFMELGAIVKELVSKPDEKSSK